MDSQKTVKHVIHITINMSPEQFLQLKTIIDAQIETSTEKHVNGKIRALDKKIDDYIATDTAWKKEDERWKENAQPTVDLGQDALGFGRVFKWILGTGVAVWAFIKIFK